MAANEQLTVVVFKDSLPARTFLLPLNWFRKLGWLAIGTTVVLLALIAVCIKLALRHPASQSTTAVAPLPAVTVTITAPATAGAPANAAAPAVPVPTVTVTQEVVKEVIKEVVNTAPLVTAPAAPIAPTGAGTAFSFTLTASPDPKTAPIAIRNPVPQWQSSSGSWRRLIVDFDLVFLGTSGGPQTGKIVVLARGADALLGYPAGTFTAGANQLSLDLTKAETFSVRSLRKVRAEFNQGGFAPGALQSAEALIFDSNNSLLLRQTLTLPAAPKPPKPVASPKPKPKSETDAPVEGAAGAPAAAPAPAPTESAP